MLNRRFPGVVEGAWIAQERLRCRWRTACLGLKKSAALPTSAKYYITVISDIFVTPQMYSNCLRIFLFPFRRNPMRSHRWPERVGQIQPKISGKGTPVSHTERPIFLSCPLLQQLAAISLKAGCVPVASEGRSLQSACQTAGSTNPCIRSTMILH